MTALEATTDWAALDARHASGLYARRPLTLVEGRGAWLWDDAGRRYLDCASGMGVANLGHCHPAVTAAIAAQAARLVVCPEAFVSPERATLAARLAALTPLGLERIFLCNSGAEAVEAALKFARLSTGRSAIVATMRAFHGRTFGALSATWEKHYREPFAPLLPDVAHVPFNNGAALANAVTPRTAAVILELVQGEGGVHPADAAFVAAARRLCDENGALLIIDEVQTGFGRTGALFACEHFGLVPDLLCLAKALGGGVPMGAVAIGPRVQNLAPGRHGTTFGGNPLACAAALAVLDVLADGALVARARTLGAELRARITALRSPLVREVRGLGLMIGIELRSRVAPVLQALQEQGVIALAAGTTVLRLLPPLILSDAEADLLLDALASALGGAP